MIDNKTIIDFYIRRLNKTKWQITFRTDKGIQVKKMKQLNRLGFWTGLFLLPFWGIGFVIWVLTLLDYWLQQEKTVFVTVEQMVKQIKEAK